MNLIIKQGNPLPKMTAAQIFDTIRRQGPMKAMEFNGQDVDGWYEQAKLMGVRGILFNDVVISKLGNELAGVSRNGWDSQGLVLDGEFYCHGMSQQDIVSAVKVPSGLTDRLDFYVFDIINFKDLQTTRMHALEMYTDSQPKRTKLVRPTTVVGNPLKALDYWLKMGYEGVVFRHPHAAYHTGPQPTLLKYKNFKEIDVKVCCRYEGEGKYKGMLGGFRCRTSLATYVNVGGGYSDEERQRWWDCKVEDLPIDISIKYQYLSPDNVPVHPSFIKTLPTI